MDCGLHPSDYLTRFLDSCPFGEQLEGVLQSYCHGRLPTRDPDCPRYLKIDSLLPLLHSLLPVPWEPGTDKLLLSFISWGTRACSLGTVVVPNSSCRQDAKQVLAPPGIYPVHAAAGKPVFANLI